MMENGRTDNGYYNETDIIETTDEDGQVHIFEKISELEVDGQEYALLIYKGNSYDGETDEKKDEGYEEEVVVMKISYEDGQEVFEAIEDEDSEVSIDLSEFMGIEEDSEEESRESNN
jgi:hypothetical protein